VYGSSDVYIAGHTNGNLAEPYHGNTDAFLVLRHPSIDG
jgi:hypothetical protein